MNRATASGGSPSLDALVLDLLEWIGTSPRRYTEVMEAWRTSCPRLPVWEEATDRGFVERHCEPGCEPSVSVTIAGRAFLARRHR